MHVEFNNVIVVRDVKSAKEAHALLENAFASMPGITWSSDTYAAYSDYPEDHPLYVPAEDRDTAELF